MKAEHHIAKTMEVFAPFANEEEELFLWLLVVNLNRYMDMYARKIKGLAHRAETHHDKGIAKIIAMMNATNELNQVDNDLAQLILRLHIWQDAQYAGIGPTTFKIPQDERTWNIYGN